MALMAAVNEWRALLGGSNVLLESDAQKAYGADASGCSRRIAAALQIQDAASLPEVMRIASRNKVPVYPISTGRNWGYGTALPAVNDCVIVDLSRLQRIIHFDQELGVVTVEPGVTQQILANFLNSGGHPFLVPVTGAGPQCSLVGNALERGYGITPYTDHFGAVTDVEAVLADGSTYRTAMSELGGEEIARLFKWGIGPYSAGLFTQSGFGIVTRLSIVLARRPECVKACFFGLSDDRLLETATLRIRSVLGKLPGVIGGINLMNRYRVLAMSAPYPKDCIGSNGLIEPSEIERLGREYQVLPWTGFGTLYGTKLVVEAAQREIKAALNGVATRLMFLSPQRAASLSGIASRLPGAWGKRLSSTVNTVAKGLELVNGRPNETALPLAYWRNPVAPGGQWRDPSRDGCGLIWYAPLVPMRSEAMRRYVDMVTSIATSHGIEPLITFTSLNDRLFDSTVPIIFNRHDSGEQARATACYEELFSRGRELGFFPYRVGVDTMSKLASIQSTSSQFHLRLRRSIDPDGLIAPGRYQ
jgi:4-cresol dehydrogenase (hydroxylating) flavoprotein subunit